MEKVPQKLDKWAVILSDWKHAAKLVTFADPISRAHLKMDSSEFQLGGKSSVHKHDAEWYLNESSPAQRCIAVVDASSKPVTMWGRYSPKVYEIDFLTINSYCIEVKFSGSTVIAENDLALRLKLLTTVKFLIK